MFFIHIAIVPIVFFFISLLLTDLFNKDDFIQLFKFFFFGLVLGLVILFIYSLIEPFFKGRAGLTTILLKSIALNGLLFTVAVSFSYYFLIDFLSDISFDLNWTYTTVYCFSYLSGIFTVLSFFQAINKIIPQSISYYSAFLSYLISLSILIGYAVPKFIEAFETFQKILIIGITTLILTTISAAYYFLTFYQSRLFYCFIILFIILFPILFFKDMKSHF